MAHTSQGVLVSTELRENIAASQLVSSTATPLVLPAGRKRKTAEPDNQPDAGQNDRKDKTPKTKKQRKQEREDQKKSKLSRALKKRLERQQAKREKKDQRTQLLNSLSERALAPDQLKLLHPSTSLGQKETLKKKLRRAFIEKQTLGYSLTEAPLEKVVATKPIDTPRPFPATFHFASPTFFQTSLTRDEDLKPTIPLVDFVPSPPQPESIPQASSPPSTASVPGAAPVSNVKANTKTPSSIQPPDASTVNVQVSRKPEIEKQRAELPIYMEEQRIMEAVLEHDVLVICGETGSGKTTQVPQFLYEAGFGSEHLGRKGMIGITQPRRVAAVSMATRVAEEMNAPVGSIVAYQVRYDSMASEQTAIKFMTDGILLKEIQFDFLLRRYSVIIIDEAHERNLNTDILIGLLSRIVPLRRKLADEFAMKKEYSETSAFGQGDTIPPTELLSSKVDVDKSPPLPLKLLIMSATLRVDDFVSNPVLFPSPPKVLSVDARQHPVTIHFNRRTPTDYVAEAFRKVCKIHTRLPSGGILVFLSGQQEIDRLCRELRDRFPVNKSPKQTSIKAPNDDEEHGEDHDILDKFSEKEGEPSKEPLHVLPLYSALPTRQQLRVFDPPPEGCRLVVVATNVAETSLTIPFVKYVVDTGKVKEKYYDKASGISSYRVVWTSVASANQRAGRAGRTGPGHAYRLYSSAVFNDHFEKFSEPEILRIPIEGVVLQMKSMSIEQIMSFPFPTPPDSVALSEAMKILRNLGALDATERITPLGRTIASLPLAPRYAKMLVLGRQGKCLPYVLSLVAALSVEEPLLCSPQLASAQSATNEVEDDHIDEKEERRRTQQRILARHAPWRHPQSDILTILRAVGAATYASLNPLQLERFCDSHFINEKVLKEIFALREQLASMIQDAYGEECPLEGLRPPDVEQEILLRQIVAAGLVDQVARKEGKIKEGIAGYCYQLGRGGEGWIHPSSSVSEASPEWLVYTSVVATSRPYMRAVSAIHPGWLVELAAPLCDFGAPLDSPAPRYDTHNNMIKCWVNARYGPQSWELGLHEIDMPPSMQRYKYFMRFLLEGKVFPALLSLRECLTGKPATVVSTTQSSHKTLAMLLVLSNNEIYSKDAFLRLWRQRKDFLLPEMKLWVKPEAWPRLLSAWALLGGGE